MKITNGDITIDKAIKLLEMFSKYHGIQFRSFVQTSRWVEEIILRLCLQFVEWWISMILSLLFILKNTTETATCKNSRKYCYYRSQCCTESKCVGCVVLKKNFNENNLLDCANPKLDHLKGRLCSIWENRK